ncbi:Hypothetical protein, partial CDS, partial [Neorhizobium galegae bv. orientalis]
ARLSKPETSPGASRTALKAKAEDDHHPHLAYPLQPRPAPARPSADLHHQGGQNWMPIRGEFWTPIDSGPAARPLQVLLCWIARVSKPPRAAVRVDMMRVKRSKAASDKQWSIWMDVLSCLILNRPTFRIAMVPSRFCDCLGSPSRSLPRHLPTWDTLATGRKMRHWSTSRSSASRRIRSALPFIQSVGLSSASSLGSAETGGYGKTRKQPSSPPRPSFMPHPS